MRKLEEATARLERALTQLGAVESSPAQATSFATPGPIIPSHASSANDIAARVDTAAVWISRVLRRDS